MPTIIITGGNRGIGAELARLYAAAGNSVVLGVRSPDKVRPQGGVEALPLDVADGASVAAFARALDGRPVDILINNAGVIGPDSQSAAAMDFDGFAETLAINTLGPLRVTQALLPHLRAARGAKVAIISSQMGSLSYAASDHVAYRASKAAVNKVAQCLATDLSREGIAVASLHPGWVRTDMGGPNAAIAPEESGRGVKAVIDRLDLKRTGRFWNYDGREIDW